MPEQLGEWSWSQRPSNGGIVAVMLVRTGHTIGITFPRPAGWTGDPREDQDFVRAILSSAVAAQWSAGPPMP